MKQRFSLLLMGGMMATTALFAENSNSGYFLDNYNYRYQLNPAFGNECKNFVAFPGLGNLNVAVHGNTHLTDFIHVVNGKTVLFTNPDVSSSFLNNMAARPRLAMNVNETLLAGGWTAWGGYNTVTISAKADAALNIPKSLVMMLKKGITNDTYSFNDLNLMARGYAEIALNHSRDIPQVPGLRAGAAVKFLFGIANMEMKAEDAYVRLGEDAWTARTKAAMYANLGGFRYKMGETDGRPYVNGFDMNGDGSIGVNGFGMAVDLGAVYKWQDFEFSLAVNDLGGIAYYDTKKASTDSEQFFNSDDYHFSVSDNKNNGSESDAKKDWDNMRDDLTRLFDLNNDGNVGTRSVGIGTTLNVGVKYTLPYYRNLSFGLLSSSRFQDNLTWTEVRISANVRPIEWFGASVNGTFGTYGAGFGWMLNFYRRFIAVHIGMDNTLGRLAKQGLPLNSNAQFNIGITVPF